MEIGFFISTFQQLNQSNLDLLSEIYESKVVFQDPIQRVEGLVELREYFARMYANISHIEFDFITHVSENNNHVLTWEMSLSHPRLNRDRVYKVPGCSHLVFESKCVFHRDYFDLGALLYEHVFGVGPLIRLLKNRI